MVVYTYNVPSKLLTHGLAVRQHDVGKKHEYVLSVGKQCIGCHVEELTIQHGGGTIYRAVLQVVKGEYRLYQGRKGKKVLVLIVDAAGAGINILNNHPHLIIEDSRDVLGEKISHQLVIMGPDDAIRINDSILIMSPVTGLAVLKPDEATSVLAAISKPTQLCLC